MIIKLKPILKHRLWGGNFLPKIYGIDTNDTIGEAWILSCINNDNCQLDDGTTLLDLFNKNPDLVAKGYKGKFPLLIKLIDAKDDLSIQVHPQAKTEFWHILNTNPSKLYMGFKNDVSKQEVTDCLNNGSITTLLNYVDVKSTDSFLINPGTIHAIGKGTFLIEIQQSADVTYRLFDFNRVDANGKPRELHINQALDCINYSKYIVSQTNDTNHIVSCKFFNVYRYDINDKLSLNATEKSFHSVVILDGNGDIKINNKTCAFKPYDSFLITAGSGIYEINGKCTVILTTL